MKKILCIGDLALDVISQLKEPINYGNDTASKISSHPGGQAGLLGRALPIGSPHRQDQAELADGLSAG